MDTSNSENSNNPSSSLQTLKEEGIHPSSELAKFFPNLVRSPPPSSPQQSHQPHQPYQPPPQPYDSPHAFPAPAYASPHNSYNPGLINATPNTEANMVPSPSSPYYSSIYLARQNSQNLNYSPQPQPYPVPYSSPDSQPIHPILSQIVSQPAHPSPLPSPVVSHATPTGTPKAKKDKQPGTRLTGTRIVYNLDHQGSTPKKQLEATPITIYNSQDAYNQGCLIAANKNYICYAIRGEMVRVLSRVASTRALLRGHTGSIMELAFFDQLVASTVDQHNESTQPEGVTQPVDLLASTGKDGNIFLWKIDCPSAESIVPVVVLRIFSAAKQGKGYFHRVRWHPSDSNILAAVSVEAGGGIYIFNISSLLSNAQNDANPQCDIDQLDESKGVRIFKIPDNTVVQDVVFSPNGTLLAAGSDDGRVRVWDLQTNQCIYDWLDDVEEQVSGPHNQTPTPVSTILMPNQSVIVTSTHKNSTVHLWNLPPPVSGYAQQPTCQQSIAFTSQKEFLGHLAFDPTGSFLFLASVNLCVGFIIHLDSANKDRDNRAHTTKFDYLTEFEVTQPILSFTVGLQATPQVKEDGNEDAEKREFVMQLFCVQTKAIQIHQTSSEHCYNPSKHTLEEDANGPITQLGKISEYDNESSRPQTLSASAERMAQYNQHQQNKWLAHSVETSRNNYPEEQYQDPILSPLSTAPVSPFVPSDQPTKQPENGHTAAQPVPIHLDSQSEQTQQEEHAQQPVEHRAQPQETEATPLETHEQLHAQSHEQPLDHPHEQPQLQEQAREQLTEQPKPDDHEQSQEQKPQEQLEQLHEHPQEQPHTSQTIPSDDKLATPHDDNKANLTNQDAAQDRNVTLPVQSNQTGSQQNKPAKTRGNRGKKDNNIANSDVQSPTESVTTARLSPQPQAPHSYKQKSISPAPVAILNRKDNTTSSPQKEAPRTTSPVPTHTPTTQDELRRFEANMMAKMEKLFVQQLDKQYARLDKERQERERLEKERQEKLLAVISQTLNSAIQQQVERVVRKELHTGLEKISKDIVQSIESLLQRTLQDSLKKSVHGAVPKADVHFKEALDKSLPQMSMAVSEALRQPIQQSFVQYFQDKLIPSFDQSCKVMFNQLNSTFEHGIQDVLASQKASNTTSNSTNDSNVLADQLRMTVQTLLDVTSSMSSNIVATQNKLLASHQASTLPSQSHYQPTAQQGPTHQQPLLHAAPPPVTHPMHVAPYQNPQSAPSHLPVPPESPTTSNMHATLMRLISQRRYNEAFDMALSASSLPLVAWLCRMIGDPQAIFSSPISQPVLVSLVQQLAYDLDSETALKFKWLQEVVPYVDVRGMNNDPGQVRDIMFHLHSKLEENYAKYANPASAHSVPFKILYQTVCKQTSAQ